MATPSEKSPEMVKALDLESSVLFGRTRTDALETTSCILCGGPAKDFDNQQAEKEYTISGMCERCQL